MNIFKKRFRLFFLGIFLLLFAISFCIYFKDRSGSKPVSLHTAHIQHVFAVNKASTTSASLLMTPTLSPTPSPIVYSGYCLNVPVLMYHHTAPWEIAKAKGFTSLDVDNGVFDLQMGYLASHGYNTIFAEDLVNALRNHVPLPSKSIVVSLDDGYDDVYSYAFQVAKKYGVKLTLFVPTGLLGNVSATNSYYTWGQLKEMLGSGLVSVGNHTWSHYPMGSKGADKDTYEVSTAQKELQQNVGKNPITFAYPYGTNANPARAVSILQQNNILGAFSTVGGTMQCDSFMYFLHRTRVGNTPFPAYGIY